jgi:hypothetical protein
MPAATGNFNHFVDNSEHKAVFFINPQTIPPCQIARENFQFSGALISVAVNIFYQRVYFFQGFLVLLLPV